MRSLLRAVLFVSRVSALGAAACGGDARTAREAPSSGAPHGTGATVVIPPEATGSAAGVPEPGAAITDAVRVAAGDGMSVFSGCYVARAGQVRCWGGPNVAHYVTQRRVPMKGPVTIAGIDGAVGIWMGRQEHCALLRDGSVRCWTAGIAPSNPGVSDMVKLALGSGHACGLTKAGEVLCWGRNLNGALGDPGLSHQSSRPPGRVALPGGSQDPVVDIAAFDTGTCAVRRGGSVVCWGSHPFTPYSSTPQELVANTAPRTVPGLSDVRAVALTGALWALVSTDRILQTSMKRDAPGAAGVNREEVALPGAAAIAAAGDTAYILGGDGRVHVWGPGATPRMMNSEESAERRKRRSAFAPVPSLDGVTGISASGSHACAVTGAGHVRCWGLNDYGGLGDGKLESSETPTFVVEYKPTMLPDAKGGTGSCTGTSAEVRGACAVAGDQCYLTAPPGHWDIQMGGAMCGQECMKRIEAVLSSRPVPACICSCSSEYAAAAQSIPTSMPPSARPSAPPSAPPSDPP